MQAEEESGTDHFVGYLGLDIWHEGDVTFGRATIRRQMWVPGTRRTRMGLLFTMADIVGGSPATGPLTPTIELRFQLLAEAPSEGDVRLEARPLKVGRRLWIGEVGLYAGASQEMFARCEFSFMNQSVAGLAEGQVPVRRHHSGTPALPVSDFDELFAMRQRGDGSTEMDAHEAVRNGAVGTIQGGAQATMVEVTAERALATRGAHVVSDLHVRYLSTLKVGPAVARPRVLTGDPLRPVVLVSITDEGAGGRLVSTAVAVCRPVAVQPG
jgi:acyl-coenzyme A thioesterase PaaI-like protein